jgi:hypothetical protein
MGYNSFGTFPPPFAGRAPLFADSYNDLGRSIYFRVGVNPNWYDLVCTFSAFTSSSTSNPWGLVLILRGTPYPYLGYVELLAFTSTGSPIWQSGSNSYCGANLPSLLNTTIAAMAPGDYDVFFVFNDTSVQVAATVSFMWKSDGPSNVILKNDG